jgi:DNA modification methylase
VREALREAATGSAQTCVTSPPYWGLRKYGDDPKEIGREPTPELYTATLVQVFREVWRVLKPDGTLWLNLGDSYTSGGRTHLRAEKDADPKLAARAHGDRRPALPDGLKPKDLVGIPWRVAFALQAAGWYLRSEVIWAKPNPMPESVTDRPTKAHETIFLLAKQEDYFYDAEAIREPASEATIKEVLDGYAGEATKDFLASGAQEASATKSRIIEGLRKRVSKVRGHEREHEGFRDRWDSLTKAEQQAIGSNKRSVWTVATKPYKDAHFAVFPPELILPCVLAGSRPGDTVLDPFSGSGTTAQVANDHGRHFVGCELYKKFAPLISKRTEQPGLIFLEGSK